MTGKIKTTTRQLCVRVETRLRNMGVSYDYLQNHDNITDMWKRVYIVSDIDTANKDAWTHLKDMFGTDVEFSEEEE